MKLKFLLWAAMSLTFTGVFTSCGDEDVMEQVKEEEEKEDEEGKEENDEKGEDEKNEVDSDEILDILEFDPTSDSTVKVTGIKDKFLTEITIPSTIQVYGKEYKVTSFKYIVFQESNVKSVKLAESFTEIPDYMFYSCSGLTSIEIPSSVTSIGDGAFVACSGLTSIEIPSSVTSIGNSAFRDCYSLTSIQIPSSVTSIGESAFYNCYDLTSIEVSTNNPNYTSINGVLFDEDIKTLISCPEGLSGKFSIPSSVTSIGNGAFYSCYDLTSIEIPSSVTSIGNGAFRDCSGLTSIEIPSSVTSIGYRAFEGCEKADIVIDNSEENVHVESYAFANCKSVTWKR